MSGTVTVTFRRKKYWSEFSKLPGQEFGPYDFAEIVSDLRVSALLEPLEARDLVLDANANGSATTEVG